MPIYRYSALTPEGKRVSAVIDADTVDMVKERLRKQKIFLTKISEVKNEKIKLSSELLLNFTREMAQLLKAGLPLFESLLTLEEKYRKHRTHPLFLDLCDRLKSGNPLSAAMKRHQSTFDPIYIAMIESAERGGSLPQIFDQLAQFLSRNIRLKKKLISAFTYPTLLFAFSIGVVFLLLCFVIPQMKELFEGRELHPMTGLVVTSSRFVESNPFLIVMLLLSFPIGILAAFRNEGIKKKIELSILKLPLLKTLFMQSALSRFSRTISFLLNSGVPLLEALRLSKGSLNFAPIKEIVIRAEEHIVSGGKLSHFFREAPFLPPLVFRMIAIGEETGHLAKMFTHLAEITDEDLERNLEQFTSLLQPLLLIFLGGVVGLVLLAVLLPLTDVGSFL